MTTDAIETNQTAGEQAAQPGVQGTTHTPQAGVAGVLDAQQDQGEPRQSDPVELDENGNPIAPAVELDEWEDDDGTKHRIPKALIPRLMKDRDYTQKTQEHAEVVRQAEQRLTQAQQQLTMQVQAQQQHLQQRAQLAALDMEIAKYAGVNWALAGQQDPGAAQQSWLAYQQLKEQRTGVANQLQTMESQFIAQTQQQANAAKRQAHERMTSIVAEWTPDDRAAVNEIGSKVYGVKAEHFEFFAANPGLLPILRDAVRYQRAQERAASAAKPANKPPAAPAPTIQSGTGRATPRSLDDPGMPMDEWMARRREQLRKQRKN